MIEINLVPDVKQELIKAQRVRSTVTSFAIFIGIVSVSIVVALAVYVFTIQTVRGGIADQNIKVGSKKLTDIKDLSKTLTIQNQLTRISDLNNNKKIDSRVFDLLNAIIPPTPNDVKVSDLTVDASTNTIIINGQASNSYAAVEVFKKTIAGAKLKYSVSEDSSDKLVKKEKIIASSISTSNTSYGEDSTGEKVLRFTLSFVYIDEMFSPSSKDISIIIANKGNATDSYIGIPNIFADRASDIMGDQ